jgi:hypothetical protein
MTTQFIPERRKVPRESHTGPLELSFDDPIPTTVHAELIEVSAMGFRAAHQCTSLDAGIEVRYQWEGASGRARVIWTHVLDGHRVSGFLLL